MSAVLIGWRQTVQYIRAHRLFKDFCPRFSRRARLDGIGDVAKGSLFFGTATVKRPITNFAFRSGGTRPGMRKRINQLTYHQMVEVYVDDRPVGTWFEQGSRCQWAMRIFRGDGPARNDEILRPSA